MTVQSESGDIELRGPRAIEDALRAAEYGGHAAVWIALVRHGYSWADSFAVEAARAAATFGRLALGEPSA